MPGQKISEKDIKTDIGIVRTPVREAILRLKQEGLINVIPKSGTYISCSCISLYIYIITPVILITSVF